MISFVARDMFTMGIAAVVGVKLTPGIVPMIAGKMIIMFNGATRLWASLYVLP